MKPGMMWCSGTKGKNRFLPSLSLLSPASTPSLDMHCPISTSSDPPPSCLQTVLSGSPTSTRADTAARDNT